MKRNLKGLVKFAGWSLAKSAPKPVARVSKHVITPALSNATAGSLTPVVSTVLGGSTSPRVLDEKLVESLIGKSPASSTPRAQTEPEVFVLPGWDDASTSTVNSVPTAASANVSGGSTGNGAFYSLANLLSKLHDKESIVSQVETLLSDNVIPSIKKHVPFLRRYALRINARDPFHNSALSRILNGDIHEYTPSDYPLYLSHATHLDGPSTYKGKPSSAVKYIKPGYAHMPSTGVTTPSSINNYGAGMTYDGKLAKDGIPVVYVYGNSVINHPDTVTYNIQDAFTPTYGSFLRHNPGLDIKHAYKQLKSEYSKPRWITFSGGSEKILPVNGLEEARTLLSGLDADGSDILALESKPYWDVPTGDIKAALIGLGSNPDLYSNPSRFKGIRELERLLGNKNIPYYFTTGSFKDAYRKIVPGTGTHTTSGFILDPVTAVKTFAPEL